MSYYSETFLMTRMERLVNILGYSLETNNRKDHKGGGIAILIKHGTTFKKRTDLNMMNEKTIESVHMDVTAKNGNIYTIGCLYRAPNSDTKGIMDHIDHIVNKTNTKTKSKLIIGMDQNLDLLKSEYHHITRKFMDLILDLNLWPVITRPTRITQRTATLIDNIHISKNLQCSFDSAIIIDDISDYLPTVALLRQTKVVDKSQI